MAAAELAAELAAEFYDVIYDARVRRGHEIDDTMDLTRTGVLGVAMSEVTSLAGDVTAKRTGINPNFAAVVVQMLHDAGAKKGDIIAVGVSGSFRGINACVYAAIETMQLEPIIIASGAASQWGANLPDLLWIDMERELADARLISHRWLRPNRDRRPYLRRSITAKCWPGQFWAFWHCCFTVLSAVTLERVC